MSKINKNDDNINNPEDKKVKESQKIQEVRKVNIQEDKKIQDNKEDLDCDCFAQSRTKKACPPVRNVTHPLRYYEFTQEEMKALEECDRESFYQRCLPFSTLFATITYAAIKCDILHRNQHFGAVPKVSLAVIVGYGLGRLSYMSHCDNKLRKLPADSHLGNVMRKYHADNINFSNPPKLTPKK